MWLFADGTELAVDPREQQSWDGLARSSPSSWERYHGFGCLDRWTREADEALDEQEASRKRQLGLAEVVDAFGDVRSQKLSLPEIIIIAFMGLWMMFPIEKVAIEIEKLWRDVEKRRPEFRNVTDALAMASGQPIFGMGSGPWVSKEDGPVLRVAADQLKGQRGKRDMKPARQTPPGSLGGAPGLGAVGVHADVRRTLESVGIDSAMARYIGRYYAAGAKVEDESPQERARRRTAARAELATTYRFYNGHMTPEELSDEAFGELMKRSKKTAEKALRRLASNAISSIDGQPHDADECPLLRPAAARESDEPGPAAAPPTRAARNWDAEVAA